MKDWNNITEVVGILYRMESFLRLQWVKAKWLCKTYETLLVAIDWDIILDAETLLELLLKTAWSVRFSSVWLLSLGGILTFIVTNM